MSRLQPLQTSTLIQNEGFQTCNIPSLDLDVVSGVFHHHLLIHHRSHLADHGSLRPSCPGEPLLVGEHRHLLRGEVSRDDLDAQSSLIVPGNATV